MNKTIIPIALLSLLAGSAVAGPLNPPAGPVTSTNKTLTEVEPRTAISAANTPGNSAAVFTISQPGSYYLTGNVSVPSGKSGIVIAASGVTLDLNGFAVIGQSGAVNGVSSNGVYYYDTTVKNGTVQGFAGSGAGVDLSAIWGGHVQGVSANSNGIGIKVFDALVESCTAVYNTTGFSAPNYYGNFVQCTATSNTGAGFVSLGIAVFDRCTSTANGGRGFDIGTGSTIRGCVANNNSFQGIVCADTCVIAGNELQDDGGATAAAIWAQGNFSTIDNNDIANCGWGIYCSSTGNLIIRNRVGSSTQGNFYVPANNKIAVIVNVSNNAAVINGSSGGGLGTTDPYANLAR